MKVLTGKTRLGLRVFCGAACYNAQTLKCSCVCNGQNHRAGLDAALRNSKTLLPELADLWNEIHPDDPLVELTAHRPKTSPPKIYPLLEPLTPENMLE